MVDLCVKTAAGRVPVIAGAGSNSTAEAIELARHARAVGADAVLIATGYYNRPSQEGLYRHFAAVNEAVDIPIVVYNVPSRTIVDIGNETLARLSRLPNILGVKDATGDVARVSQQMKVCGPDWVLLSGDDPTALGYIAHGGHGCISVTANARRRPARPSMTPRWPGITPPRGRGRQTHRPPQGVVRRALSGADQVRPGPSGTVCGRHPSAAHALHRSGQAADPRRDGGGRRWLSRCTRS